MKKKIKESLYNYHRHFYNYWYFHFIAIMLNSVLTLRVLVSSLFLPPCGAVTLPPFRDTVTPLQNTKTNGLEERSWPHALGALCREAKAPHFTRTKKLKPSYVKKLAGAILLMKSRINHVLMLRRRKLQTHYASKQTNVGNTCFLYYHGACCNRGYIILIKLLAEG